MAIGANLTKRDQMMISAMVMAVALAGAYGYFLYMPKRAQLATIQAHVEALDKKNEQAKADLANGSVEKMKTQAAEYQASLKVLQQLVPTTNEVPALLENVSTAARRVGLDIASVEPMPVIVGEQFDTYRYKVSVKGGYHALAGFLTNVGSLNRIVAPVALDVKQMTPADKKKARPKEGESTLDTDFQIQTYIAHPVTSTGDAVTPET
ncbi:MAG TPA: type 4a pilus biogenesis protein PilO, partial [Gemmatimonadaceae bacterium]|nr:type 4a pilus biogenesis protein PilO [Gemmatimonadaceae bacterium]